MVPGVGAADPEKGRALIYAGVSSDDAKWWPAFSAHRSGDVDAGLP